MAVVLNTALSGPRSYHGEMREFPWVWPEGRRNPGPDQIDQSVTALWRAWGLMLALVVVLALL
jgi:adenosylcobinamide-phosphate synthase